MKPNPTRIIVAICMLVVGTASQAARGFQNTLSEEALTRACSEWRADALIQDFKATKREFPISGALVWLVDPDSFGEKNGIVPGSVVLRRGRFEYGNSRDALDPSNKKALDQTKGELAWVTPDNMLHTAPIGKELIGINYKAQRNIAFWYLRYGNRNPRWDIYVLTALLSQSYDAAVSESCWAAACAKGYKQDQLSHWCGIFLSIARGDFAAAEIHTTAFGEPTRPLKESDFPLLASDWVELAFQTGNMKRLVQAGTNFLGYSYDPRDAEWLAGLASQKPLESSSPSKLSNEMKHRSFLGTGTTNSPSWATDYPDHPSTIAFPKLFRKAMAAGGSSPGFTPETLKREIDTFGTAWLVPTLAAPNLDLQIQFTIEPLSNRPGTPAKFNRSFLFGMVNNDDPDESYVMFPSKSRILVTELSFGIAGITNEPRWMVYASSLTNKYTTSYGMNSTPLREILRHPPAPPSTWRREYSTPFAWSA